MPRPATPSGHYRPGLDGIRALAVAAVLAYHFDAPWLPGGLLGVGVFFTLSGFLITSILMSTWERCGNLNLKDFWLRRARRLMPALVLVVTAVVVATVAVAPSQLGSRLRESFGAAFYVTNWVDIVGGDSYFDQFTGPAPFDHLWSLAVEEQFYLIWPLILLALLHMRRGQHLRVGLLTSGLAAASFALMWRLAEPGFDHTRVYEGTDTRAGGVLVGAALAIFLHAARTQSAALGTAAWDERPAPWWLDALGVAGLATITFLALTTDQYSTSLYTYGILALSLATVAVVAAAAHPHSRVAGWLSLGVLRWVGERSYGIYLWHMPIIALMPVAFLGDQPWLRGGVALALTLMISATSWTLVENPIRTRGLRASLQRPRQAPGHAVAAPGAQASQANPAPDGAQAPQAFPAAHTAHAAPASAGDRDAPAGHPPARAGAPNHLAPPTPHRHVPAAVGSVLVVLLGATLVSCSAIVSSAAVEPGTALGQAPATTAPLDPTSAGSAGADATRSTPAISATPTPAETLPPILADSSATPEDTPFAQVSANAKPRTSCTAVVHVGDSTSLGLVEDGGLDKRDQVVAQYTRVGVKDAAANVKGARSIVERWHDEPNAQDAVKAKVDDGYDGCWVIAMGTNEVANQSVGGSHPLAERIDLIMSEVKGAPVLWPTVKTQKTTGPWQDTGMTEMSNELRAACARYPNLRVYDWRSEVKDAWFEADGIHFTTNGYKERGHRFADALAHAFPADGPPSDSCFVSSR